MPRRATRGRRVPLRRFVAARVGAMGLLVCPVLLFSLLTGRWGIS